MMTRRLPIFAIVIFLAVTAWSARAAYYVEFAEQGSNVIATGSGVLYDGWEDFPSYPINLFLADLNAFAGIVWLHSESVSVNVYTGITAPSTFDPVTVRYPDSGSGDVLGVAGDLLILPAGYVAGTPLANSDTWENESFASLGLTPGVYTWTWGSGETADSFTVNVVPEPATVVMAGLGFGLLALSRRRGM